MFNSNKKVTVGNSSISSKSVPPSLLSSDLIITGNLESTGDMQIDGTIDGDVKSTIVTISSSGVVRGTIEAEEVTIAGQVTGQIRARHVVLLKGAKVIADLIQDKLSIEPGAFFEGSCSQYTAEEGYAMQLEYAEPK
ncbi:MAG: hypothetical protein CMM58_05785 [Rhodospirillaceae bacterium]|nr:hypothetical protein [Rhodospirillaceae bacterium]|tara:strand:- start:5395 stop:5805 length:411 start_codon:yes stop_codon:yes gene_type:complete